MSSKGPRIEFQSESHCHGMAFKLATCAAYRTASKSMSMMFAQTVASLDTQPALNYLFEGLIERIR